MPVRLQDTIPLTWRALHLMSTRPWPIGVFAVKSPHPGRNQKTWCLPSGDRSQGMSDPDGARDNRPARRLSWLIIGLLLLVLVVAAVAASEIWRAAARASAQPALGPTRS